MLLLFLGEVFFCLFLCGFFWVSRVFFWLIDWLVGWFDVFWGNGAGVGLLCSFLS